MAKLQQEKLQAELRYLRKNVAAELKRIHEDLAGATNTLTARLVRLEKRLSRARST